MGILVKNILKHKSGRCTLRKVIPEALRPFCGDQWEYKVSLGLEGSPGFLSRYEEALRGYEELIARAQRQKDGAFDKLDAPRIAMLAELFLAQTMAEDNEARFSTAERDLFLSVCADLQSRGLGASIKWRGDPTRRWAEKTRVKLEETLKTCRNLRAIGDIDGIALLWVDEAQLLAETAGLVVDETDHAAIFELCRAINDAAIKAAEMRLRRLEGDEVPTPPEPDLEVAPRDPGPPQAGSARTRLLTIFEGYATAQKVSAGIRSEWRRYIQKLIEFLGHDDARRITVDQLIDWRDYLLREPTRHGQPRDPRTVRDKYIVPIRAALNWAVEERLLANNPASQVKVRVPKKAKLRDTDFTRDEAQAILRASLLPVSAGTSVQFALARRWVPWLCAYSGARVNEMTQLRKEDVQEIDGVTVIRITPAAGSTKTKEARLLPVHPHLIEQGFLQVVAAQPEGPLFYDASRKRIEGEGRPLNKKVGERLALWVRKDVGITDLGIKPNHGWRHTFKTLSYSAGLEERLADALQGHAPKTVGRTYGKVPLPALAAAMAKVPRFEVDSE